MKIGELKEVTFDLEEGFEGWFRTLELDLIIQLRPNPDKRSDNSPNFVVLTRTRSGQWTQVGNAWKKTRKKLGMMGEDFLSITIDDPSFDKSINVAAFLREEKTWDVMWRRRQDRPDPAAA